MRRFHILGDAPLISRKKASVPASATAGRAVPCRRMSENRPGAARNWQPPPRPEWLASFLEDTRAWDARSVAPLEAGELIATAIRNTGLEDFGPDDWREPFHVLLDAIDREADSQPLRPTSGRGRTCCSFSRRACGSRPPTAIIPEIDDEVIDRPVFVTGLPRSGTSILFELLAQDPQFMAPANWEFVLPCPPPEAATYRDDPRVPRAHELITQPGRVAPTFRSMHELGRLDPERMRRRLPHELPLAAPRRDLPGAELFGVALCGGPAPGVRALPAAAQAPAVAQPARPLAAQVAGTPVVSADAVRRVPRRARDRHPSRSAARAGVGHQRAGHVLLDAQRPAVRCPGLRGAADARRHRGAAHGDDRLDRGGPHPVARNSRTRATPT